MEAEKLAVAKSMIFPAIVVVTFVGVGYVTMVGGGQHLRLCGTDG